MSLVNWLKGEEPGLIEKILFMFTHGFDKGAYGEYLIEYIFRNDTIDGYLRTLHNVYIPYKGKNSEIDILLIHEKGLYVIESKNYSGWIFGSVDQKQWTQMINKNTKNRFYNPIKQNATHIKALCNYLNINKSITQSYIVFSERCELKKVPEDTEDYTIVRRNHLMKKIKKEITKRDSIFTPEQVNEVFNNLKPLTDVSEEVKKQHIQRIKQDFL